MHKTDLLHFIDHDLLNIFSPLQFILAPLGKIQCHFRGNRLQIPTTYSYYIIAYSFILILLFIRSIIELYQTPNFATLCLIINCYFWTNLLVLIDNLISNKKGRILKLLYEIQDIDNSLSLPKTPEYYNIFQRRNIICLVTLPVVHFMFSLVEVVVSNRYDTFSILIFLSRLSIDAELCNYNSYVDVITSRLQFLNGVLECKLQSTRVEVGSIDLLNCYRKLIHAIKLVNKIWGLQLLIVYCGEFYLISRIIMTQLMLLRSKYNTHIEVFFLLNCLVVFRHGVVCVLPALRGQRLTSQLSRTRCCCGLLLDDTTDEYFHDACKKVILLQDAVDPGLRLAGSDNLRVDGGWPLRMLAAFAACFVVQVQLET